MSHERLARRGVLLGLYGVLALLVVSLGSVAWVYDSLRDFRQAAYTRCLDRVALDTAERQQRLEQAERFRGFAEQERTNRFIDDDLRQQRMEAWVALAEANERAAATEVRGTCAVYRP